MSVVPNIISVDDHLVEPPDLWQRRLPAKHREKGPRLVSSPFKSITGDTLPSNPSFYRMATEGPVADFWLFEEQTVLLTTGFAAAGQDLDTTGLAPIRYEEMRAGCYELQGRLADMDQGGIERSVCFPTVPRFCGQLFLGAKDKELAFACVRAYNDFMVEEWAGESGGRLIPLCIVPLWDPVAAADEVRRNAARGVAAVAFSEAPVNLGLPSIHNRAGYWLPFLEACDETETVVCMHIGSGARPPDPNEEAPVGVTLGITTQNAQASMFNWLLSGLLGRFPNLKIAFSEGQIGWMPYVLEQADRVWEKGPKVTGLVDVRQPPSTYVPGRVYGCFFQDDAGIEARYRIGVSQITFESDYPHQDSTWPNTLKYASKALDGLPDEEVDLICRGNAIKLFRLPQHL